MLNRIRRLLFEWSRAFKASSIESRFVRRAPRPQNVADIFRGNWASRLPISGLVSGESELFDDDRIRWFINACQGVRGRRVLELGPLEGGHSWMLDRAGASSVVAVESNSQAWLKCVAAKELLGMSAVQFLLGDFMEYLRDPGPEFDACLACGVLYHLRDPHLLFPLLRERCTGPVMIWTAIWTPDIPKRHKLLSLRFTTKRSVVLPTGRHIVLHRHEYGPTSIMSRFWGGNAPYSEWMSREDIAAAAGAAGYKVSETAFDDPDHRNAPSIAFMLVPTAGYNGFP